MCLCVRDAGNLSKSFGFVAVLVSYITWKLYWVLCFCWKKINNKWKIFIISYPLVLPWINQIINIWLMNKGYNSVKEIYLYIRPYVKQHYKFPNEDEHETQKVQLFQWECIMYCCVDLSSSAQTTLKLIFNLHSTWLYFNILIKISYQKIKTNPLLLCFVVRIQCFNFILSLSLSWMCQLL